VLSDLARLAGMVILLVGIYVLIVMWLKRARDHQRRERATDPNARVRVAWDESVEALSLLNTLPAASGAHEEFAVRAGPQLDATAASSSDSPTMSMRPRTLRTSSPTTSPNGPAGSPTR